MKRVILFLSMLFIVAQASSHKILPVDKEISHCLFNAELAKADSLINVQQKSMPDHPKYFVLKSMYYFYSRYFTQGLSRDSILQLIVANSNKAVELAEKMEESTETKFYLGSAYGFLSRAYLMQGEYWDGYWAARECRNNLNEVLEEDPTYADAYVGLGVIEYFTGLQYTGFYRPLVWIIGMAGERQKGLEYFTNAYKNGELFKDESHFILGSVNRFIENNYDDALKYLGSFREVFPNNNFVLTQYQQTTFLKLIEDNGVQLLEAEFDSLKTKYRITNSGTLNGLGYNYIGLQRLDDALAVFKTNVKLFPDEANVYDSLGECYLNRGERELAIQNYKTAWQKLDTDSTITDDLRGRLRESIPQQLEQLGAKVDIQT